MNYLSILNNEMQSILVILLFVSIIFMTITMLCEMFSNHKLKIDLFIVCRVLNIALCVIWAFIFFNFINTPSCKILACFSALVLVFEISLMLAKKDWKMALDFPFLIMLLPFWKYVKEALSVVLIVISVVYLFAKSLMLLLNSFSKLKNTINYYSLKEALDGLKTAVMFESKFNVVYENLAMKNLLEKLEINKNKSSFEIWQNLKSRQDSKIVDEQNILVFLDKKVYSFSIIKQSKIQIYAFDITKEYLTTLEIENKQAELKVKQSEILKMIENLDEIERQKEVLTLKSKLHDIIGQRLFILHHVLDAIDEKTFDLNNVKDMLKTMIGEINNDEIFETKNMQNSIITAFEMIGFNINISGEMPKEMQKAKALVKIIRECATNAIRHANATKLFVNISDDKIEISDNGKFTNQTITESTGIKGMRLNAEMLGGKLFIFTDNGFKVVIEMKK
ncbi:MAG: sensor histidine kinase [Christensenellales bacterium]